jgi:protein SCO1/2
MMQTRAKGRGTTLCRAGLVTGMLLAGTLAFTPAVRALQGEPGEHGSEHGDHAHHKAMLAAKVKMEEAGKLNIPDLPVLTQDGEEVHFYHDLVENKVVAMNFIFTTCRTICPPLGANFGKLQQILAEQGDQDFKLISVSVDPVTDTPERMKAWGETFGAGPNWTLVTGDKGDITRILKALQVFTPDYNDHSPVVLMGNAATGTWTRAYGLAPPQDLAKALESMAANGDKAPEVSAASGKGATEGGSR